MRPPHLTLCAAVAAALFLAIAPGLRAQEPGAGSAPAAGAVRAIRGDVDGDGRVTAADAQAVREYLVGRPLPQGASITPAGDANGDGRITAVDAAVITRFVAGADVRDFPVGKPEPGSAQGTDGAGTGVGLLLTQLCEVDVVEGSLSCAPPAPQTGDARVDLVLGNPGVQLLAGGPAVLSNGNAANEDTSSVPVRVRNMIGQPIGTLDGTTAAPSGIRIFFNTGPYVTAVSSGSIGTASIRLSGADSATFSPPSGSPVYTNKKFYRTVEIVQPAATTVGSQIWRFVYSRNVTRFAYSVLVSVPVQYEHGWITVSPASRSLVSGDTASFSGTVRNEFGTVVGDQIRWTSSNAGVAAVDSSTGRVTAGGAGTALITATSRANAQRVGTATVTVAAGAAAGALITTVDDTLTAGSITTVTAQTVDASGNPLSVGGETVTLSTTLGSLGPVTDNGNGTYTADLTHAGTDGTAIVTGTLNGNALADSAQVVFRDGGVQRVWTGSVSADWVVANNWSPRGVPSAADTIVINSGGTQPQITDADKTINRLVMTSAGSTLDLGGFLLNVTADADASGGTVSNGRVQMSGASRTIRGTFPSLLVTGSVQANGATVGTTLTIRDGVFTISDQTVTISAP